MLVSVLINNYNYGRFIEEAIESVLAQTYTNWELIIVDDGSTDRSIDIIEQYVNKYPEKIKAIKKENGGQASCFNVGYEASSGEIVAFLDSDDFWFPEKLEKIVEAHKTSAFVVHSKALSNGSRQSINIEQNDKRSYYFRKYGQPELNSITTSTMSLTRNILDVALPMPEEEFRICADYFVMLCGLYFTNIKYLFEELSCYRIHENNGYILLPMEEKVALYRNKLVYTSIEYLNERLKKRGRGEALVPHQSRELRMALRKEAGEGFEIKRGERYVIYGTGGSSVNMIAEIVLEGAEVVAFCDSSEEKWGTRYYSKQVLSPGELSEYRNYFDKIIIASLYYEEISQVLNNLGLKRGTDYIYTLF